MLLYNPRELQVVCTSGCLRLCHSGPYKYGEPKRSQRGMHNRTHTPLNKKIKERKLSSLELGLKGVGKATSTQFLPLKESIRRLKIEFHRLNMCVVWP